MRPIASFVNQPIRSLQSMLRVLSVQDDQYKQVIPDGIYGPQTLAAVSTFQRIHGLPITGITDQLTWNTIVSIFTPAAVDVAEAEAINIILNPNQVIRRGEANPNLYLVQAMLVVLADMYACIQKPSFTGVLDAETSSALSSFQELSQLPMTGELDKMTWRQLALQYPLAANRIGQ